QIGPGDSAGGHDVERRHLHRQRRRGRALGRGPRGQEVARDLGQEERAARRRRRKQRGEVGRLRAAGGLGPAPGLGGRRLGRAERREGEARRRGPETGGGPRRRRLTGQRRRAGGRTVVVREQRHVGAGGERGQNRIARLGEVRGARGVGAVEAVGPRG